MAAALALIGCGRTKVEATPDLAVASPQPPKPAAPVQARTTAATAATASAGAESPRATPVPSSAAPAPTAKLALRPRPPADDGSELIGFSGIGLAPIVTVGGAVSVVHPVATSGPAPAAPTTVTTVKTSVDGSSATETAQLVAKSEPRLRACGNAAHLAAPSSLAVVVVVDDSGHVASANVSGPAPTELASCVGAAFYAMQFPAGAAARSPFTAAVDFTPEP
jgi:hypothetical protein